MRFWYIIAGILALSLGLYLATNGLTHPIYNDEVHFWNASMLFAYTGWPTSTLLFSYGELNTPLPFMVFGWVENLFHGKIPGGRLVNLCCGMALLLLIAYTGRQRPRLAGLAVLGLVMNPYLYVTSLCLYTDCIPILLVLLGLFAYSRGWYGPMALAFSLAICGRQFMVVFPAGILIWEGMAGLRTVLRTRRLPSTGVLWLLGANVLACCTLLAWRLFWGDWAQPFEVANQSIATKKWHPEFGFYALACVGLYFALPIELLQLVAKPLRKHIPAALPLRTLLMLTGAVAVLYSLFSIVPGRDVIDMGPLERVLNRLLGSNSYAQPIKQVVYAALTLVALRRFKLNSLQGIWLLLQVVLWAKSHVGWDKYTYPLVVAYWFMLVLPVRDKASEETNQRQTEALLAAQ
ncbi:hypothetical protein JYG30_14290 [Fibrella sp. USSR17]